MTPEALDAVLEAGDAEACLALFAHVTEDERKAVSKRAQARYRAVSADPFARALRQNETGLSVGESLRRIEESQPTEGQIRTAQIAVLAAAPIGVLRKLGLRAVPSPEDAFAVLSTRRPPWADAWVEMLCGTSDRWSRDTDRWRLARRLIREGIAHAPRGRDYINLMLVALPGSAWDLKIRLRDALVADASLLEDEVWRIFETEPTPGTVSYTSIYENVDPQYCWDSALAELAAEGKISRTRLLDASLDGLERDYHEYRARWLAQIHEALAPRVDERAERSGRYLGLLASRNPSTVNFSVKALSILEKSGQLAPQSVVEAITPALLARAKGTVRSALELLDRVATRDTTIRRGAAAVAVEALIHESPDVHKAALDVIDRHGEAGDPELARLLSERIETVAASQRSRLESSLRASAAGTAVEVPRTEIADDFDTLIVSAGALEPPLADLAGVPIAIEAVEQGGRDVPALDFKAAAVPHLDPSKALKPVANFDELIELFSAVIETSDPPEDIERVLDGIARLCDQRPADFEVRTAPLRARMERLVELEQRHLIRILRPREPLCALGRSWITGELILPRHLDLPEDLGSLFARRVLTIARHVARREAVLVLSMPTHTGGWIDPRVLVARVLDASAKNLSADPADFSIALLRLAPEHRFEALRMLGDPSNEARAALVYALGGGVEAIGPTAMIWASAARARTPFEDDPRVEQRHPSLGPDTGRAARYTLRERPHSARTGWTRYHAPPVVVREPPLPRAYPVDLIERFMRELPTVLLHSLHNHADPTLCRWAATVWPANLEPLFADGIERFAGVEGGMIEAQSSRPYYEPLLDPDVPLRPMALTLLGTGLSAKRPDEYGLATDALIAAVDDGRLDGRKLGDTLATLLPTWLVKPSRWAKRLGDAARVSPLHARVIALALQHALAIDLMHVPKGVLDLLELLKELLIETGTALTVADARESLGRLKTSGKTANLVKALLALKENPAPDGRAAALRALRHRIERAERWQRCDRC